MKKYFMHEKYKYESADFHIDILIGKISTRKSFE